MFLFIFQSIGTQELILIGIIALIFLGPRKLPEYARKIGKVMSDLRNTTNDFKSTWEREVDFEEERRALTLEDDEPKPKALPVERENSIKPPAIDAPQVKEVAPPPVDRHPEVNGREADQDKTFEPDEDVTPAASDKRNWL